MKFTITIPSYKSRYLREAIESVINQTYSQWELIIVDDDSPENLLPVVTPYLADKRIQYHRNTSNCGAENVVDNWNICLSYASGQYIICIGDDDRLKPCCLSVYQQLINEYPGLGVYHGRTQIIDERGNPKYLQAPRPEWESAISLLWNRWDNRPDQYIGDFCYDTQQLKAQGGYYKLPLAWGSDDISAVRAAATNGIANTSEPVFEYRQNPHTITSSNNARTKMHASLSAYRWFAEFIRQQRDGNLTETDIRYLYDIHRVCHSYYYKSFGKNCADDLKGNPFKIPFWWNSLNELHFSPLAYLKWYMKSLYNIIRK